MAFLGRLVRTTSFAARRSLSTSAPVADGLIRPPVQLHGIEGRYAHALFSASMKSDALAAVEKDIKKVESLLENDAVFASFLATPILSRSVKKNAVEDLLGKMKFNTTTINFFATMAENNRLANTTEIVDAFNTLTSAHRNEVKCVVTSAEPLDNTTIKGITSSLKGFTAEGQSINVSTKVDPNIIGGLIVEVGDKYVDMSVKSRVQKLVGELSKPI